MSVDLELFFEEMRDCCTGWHTSDESALLRSEIHLLQVCTDENSFENRYHIIYEVFGQLWRWEASVDKTSSRRIEYKPKRISRKLCNQIKAEQKDNPQEFKTSYVRSMQ